MGADSKFVISGSKLKKYNGMGTKVSVPEEVKKIHEKAFYDCKTIISVELPEGITEIGYGAFWGCSNLKTINIPDSVVNFGWNAFLGCASLTSFTIPSKLTNVTQRLFNGCKSLASVTIPSEVVWIGDGAFSYCENLTSITIPEKVKSIGSYAFSGCKKLSNINIPESVTVIENGVFENCHSLTTLSIPFGVYKIERGAFQGCKGLTSIKIPKTVTEIGIDVFKDCISLRHIYFDGSDEKWAKIDKERAGIPAKTTVHTVLPKEEILNDCLCVEGTLKKYNGAGGEVVVPNGIKTIGEEAFSGSKITSITIPASVNTIRSRAFMDCCDLEMIKLSDNVNYVEDEVFKGCASLKEVTLPKTLPRVGKGVFSNCDNLKDVYVDVTKRRWEIFGFEIPSRVTMHFAEEKCEVSDGRVQGGNQVPISLVESIAKNLEGYLLKIEGSDYYSYDNSDDDRAGSSSSETPFVVYREINALENSKALLIVNNELKGVVFSVKSGSRCSYYRYYLDGSVKSSIRLGYSASHSSSFKYIERVTLVRKGGNGAPTEARSVRFEFVESDTSI